MVRAIGAGSQEGLQISRQSEQGSTWTKPEVREEVTVQMWREVNTGRRSRQRKGPEEKHDQGAQRPVWLEKSARRKRAADEVKGQEPTASGAFQAIIRTSSVTLRTVKRYPKF